MKKILIVTPAYWPGFRYGGPVKSVHLLAKHLVLSNFSVTVFTTTLHQKNNGYFEDVLDGVNVCYFPIVKLPGYSLSPLFDRGLKSQMRKFDAVLVSSTWEYTTYAGMKHARKTGVPFFLIPSSGKNILTTGFSLKIIYSMQMVLFLQV